MLVCAIAFCSLPEDVGTSDIISGTVMCRIVTDKAVKFDNPGLNLCQEIRLKVFVHGIFDAFSLSLSITSDRK